ncbi:MAG: hypothetical protein JXA10_12060 [Anaerolineae bacterium]|nr:hypothetical protein [Anaerolineae bacterium]
MQTETMATYMGLSVNEVERLLALPPAAIYDDPAYQAVVNQLDADVLRQTLGHVRAVYDKGLAPIKAKYGLSNTIMSGFTLGNWVLGYLTTPDHLNNMLDRHAALPREVIAAALPELVALLDDLPAGRGEWQRALVTFSLPLIAGG